MPPFRPQAGASVPLMRAQLCKRNSLRLAALLLFPFCASAQDLQGRFYPEKDSYMVGEPVLFNVEIKNTGSEIVYVNAKAPGSCVDTYDFLVTGPSLGCGAKWIAGCGDETTALKPGESIHGQWELDSWYQFEREGKYTVSATRHVPIQSIRGQFQDFSFSSKFDVKLEPPDPLRVQSILQQFERNLNSTDPDVRHGALDVLATTAPAYFQSVALRLSRDKDPFVVLHAARALGRLNTTETRAALADIITSREANTEEEIHARAAAIEELGHSGDEHYESLIAPYMEDRDEQIQLFAMMAVAQLGKGAAVPQIQRFFFNPKSVYRKNAAYALRYSTTPAAVEALIDAVTDKDSGVRERVSTSLTELTGHALDLNVDTASPLLVQERWRSWWRENKGTLSLPDHLEFLCHMK